MQVPVLMLAFNQLPVIRFVSVDEADSTCSQPLNMLAMVYHFGQNEVIPMIEMPFNTMEWIMDLATLAPYERQQRMNVRNLFIRASIKELENELLYRVKRGDKIGVLALQEMIDTCKAQGVENFGLTH